MRSIRGLEQERPTWQRLWLRDPGYRKGWVMESGVVLPRLTHNRAIISVSPWLEFILPPRYPQVVWCHWVKIWPFSATLAQNGFAECDQPRKIPWSTPPRLGIEPEPRAGCEIHSFSHWAIMTRATGRTDSEMHSFSHWILLYHCRLAHLRLWLVWWQCVSSITEVRVFHIKRR